MADAQLPHDDVKAALLRGNAAFQQLVSEHHALDRQLQDLSHQTYLSLEQQFTESALKKGKLALKDRIEAMVRGQAQTQTASSA
jgi:uncharacterized protein YdcH (DUF465 family)